MRFLEAKGRPTKRPVITTSSASSLTALPSESVDYVFVDPPFGSNIMYSDLNFLWESWLGVHTETKSEAIENHIQKKSVDDYRRLMRLCFIEFHRILKPASDDGGVLKYERGDMEQHPECFVRGWFYRRKRVYSR